MSQQNSFSCLHYKNENHVGVCRTRLFSPPGTLSGEKWILETFLRTPYPYSLQTVSERNKQKVSPFFFFTLVDSRPKGRRGSTTSIPEETSSEWCVKWDRAAMCGDVVLYFPSSRVGRSHFAFIYFTLIQKT